MGSIGTPEILLVLAIALLLFGPKKLPDLAKTLGRAVAEFKKASSDMRRTIEREVEDLKQAEEPGAGDESTATTVAPETANGVPKGESGDTASSVESERSPRE